MLCLDYIFLIWFWKWQLNCWYVDEDKKLTKILCNFRGHVHKKQNAYFEWNVIWMFQYWKWNLNTLLKSMTTWNQIKLFEMLLVEKWQVSYWRMMHDRDRRIVGSGYSGGCHHTVLHRRWRRPKKNQLVIELQALVTAEAAIVLYSDGGEGVL